MLESILAVSVSACIYAKFRYSRVVESVHMCHCKDDENK